MNTKTAEIADRPRNAESQAGNSSFYWAMRMLPREQRESMFEIYSFCKAVDDIADGDEPSSIRLTRLDRWRRDIESIYAGSIPSGHEKLARAVARFPLQKKDFLAVIEGMEMDCREDIRAPGLERLFFYCDRVACAVGRLSVRIFGMDEQHGELLARHLGLALQLTNILRDIDEDAAVGRLYLPREALDIAGIQTSDPALAVADPRLDVACKFVAEQARVHFMKSDEILAQVPRRVARVPRIMEEAYRRLLGNMTVRGWSPPRARVRLSRPQLLGIALRHAFV